MKKRYSSTRLKLTVNIKIDGKPKVIEFDSWDQAEKRRYIVIDDPKIQEALENNPGLTVYYQLDKDYHGEDVDAVFVEETQINEEVYEVETLAEAKKYLAENGVRTYPSMNKAKATEAAKELGIKLTIKN